MSRGGGYIPAGLEEKQRRDYFDDYYDDEEDEDDDIDSIVYPNLSINPPSILVEPPDETVEQVEEVQQTDRLVQSQSKGQLDGENNIKESIVNDNSEPAAQVAPDKVKTDENGDGSADDEANDDGSLKKDDYSVNISKLDQDKIEDKDDIWGADECPPSNDVKWSPIYWDEAEDKLTSSSLLSYERSRETRSPSPGVILLEDVRRAIINGDLDYLERQMSSDSGFFIDTVLKNSWTALMYACDYGYPEIVLFCLEHGADPNYHKDNFTPLMAACQSFYAEEDKALLCVKYLIEFGANVNACDHQLKTALMYACETGKTGVAQELAKNGADLHKRDTKNWTALHFAAKRGFGPLLRHMIDSGGDLNAFNSSGQTPADIAFEFGYHELGTLLERLRTRHTMTIEGYAILSKPDPRKAPLAINKPNYLTDMEYFLAELDLIDYQSMLESQQITYRDLLAFNEEDLDRLKIDNYGVKLKLWEGIKKAHKRNWQPSRIPLLKRKSQLSCPDAVIILKNITNHLEYMGSTVAYLKNHLRNDPDMVKRGSEIATIKDLLVDSEEALSQGSSILHDLKFYIDDIHAIQGTIPEKSLKKKSVTKVSKKLDNMPLGLGLVGIGLIGVAAIVYVQKDSFCSLFQHK